jgi:hypothetical protein
LRLIHLSFIPQDYSGLKARCPVQIFIVKHNIFPLKNHSPSKTELNIDFRLYFKNEN